MPTDFRNSAWLAENRQILADATGTTGRERTSRPRATMPQRTFLRSDSLLAGRLRERAVRR